MPEKSRGRKKLGEKGTNKLMVPTFRSVDRLEERTKFAPTISTSDIPVRALPAVTVEIPSTVAIPKPRKSASAESARTPSSNRSSANRTAATNSSTYRPSPPRTPPGSPAPARTSPASSARTAVAPRGPQVSMPMRGGKASPAIDFTRMYSSMSARDLGLVSRPASTTPRARSNPGNVSSTPAPRRATPQATPRSTPRVSFPSITGLSPATRRRHDEQANNIRSRIEEGRKTDFTKLGSSLYSGLSRNR